MAKSEVSRYLVEGSAIEAYWQGPCTKESAGHAARALERVSPIASTVHWVDALPLRAVSASRCAIAYHKYASSCMPHSCRWTERGADFTLGTMQPNRTLRALANRIRELR